MRLPKRLKAHTIDVYKRQGVNRCESDPFYGKYVPRDVAEEDVRLMKQYNINSVRTSHYGDDEYFYYLCDKYGLYMMAEANIEAHSLINEIDTMAKYFTKVALEDRTPTSFHTLKNQTSVIMWSIANETGYPQLEDSDSLKAVSYTHLDVYKRQPSISWSSALPMSCNKPARRAMVGSRPSSDAMTPERYATSKE